MRRALASSLAAVLAAWAAPAGAQAQVSPAQAAELGREAYRYGIPLLEFLRIRHEMTSVSAPDGNGNAPVNALANARAFARPSDRTVVAPNHDTLYSLAQLDLGKGPIVLSHPDMGRRYFDFEFVDPFTNVIDYVGTRTTGTSAGRFQIAWTEKPGRRLAGVPRDPLEVPPGLDDRAARSRPTRRPTSAARAPRCAATGCRRPRGCLAPAGEAAQVPAAEGWPGSDGRAGRGAGGEPAAAARPAAARSGSGGWGWAPV